MTDSLEERYENPDPQTYTITAEITTEVPLTGEEIEGIEAVIKHGGVIDALQMKGPVTSIDNAFVGSDEDNLGYTVVGVYADNMQGFTTSVNAPSPEQAARLTLYEVARQLEIKEPLDFKEDSVRELMNEVGLILYSIQPGQHRDLITEVLD